MSNPVYALPTWFTLDAATIKSDTPMLRGDQVAGLGGDTELLANINRRLPEMGAHVMGRLQAKALSVGLIASFDDDLSTVLAPGQKVEAMAATRLLVIAALFGVLPSDKNRDAMRAAQDGRGDAVIGYARLGSALSMLESLETQLDAIAQSKSRPTGAASIQVERANECEGAEYSRGLGRYCR